VDLKRESKKRLKRNDGSKDYAGNLISEMEPAFLQIPTNSNGLNDRLQLAGRHSSIPIISPLNAPTETSDSLERGEANVSETGIVRQKPAMIRQRKLTYAARVREFRGK
jgi:hypothetical protein